MTWNDQDELATDSTINGTTNYVYDADGNLLVRRDPGQTTLFLGDEQIVLNTNTGAVTGTRYYSANGQVIASRAGAANPIYLVPDRQGTDQLAITSGTLAVTRRQYLPFGAPRGTPPSTWPGDLGYVGGTPDPSTQLENLGAREYDPNTGRFLSADPVFEAGDPTQMGGYDYAGNDPVTGSDPDGLFFLSCGGICGPGASLGGTTMPTSKNAKPLQPGYATPPSPPKRAASAMPGWFGKMQQVLFGSPPPVHHPKAPPLPLPSVDIPLSPAEIAWGRRQDALIEAANAAAARRKRRGFSLGLILENGAAFAVSTVAVVTEPIPILDVVTDAGAFDLDASVGAADAEAFSGALEDDAGGDAADACANSFAGVTPVLMADGHSTPISQVKVGDVVANALPGVAAGTANQRHVVTAVHVTYTDHDYTDVTVTTDHGTATITGTAHHLYWDATTQHWTEADQLAVGDRLQTSDGQMVTTAALRDYTATMVTYNLTIDALHDYYVQAGNTAVLVHNCPVARSRAEGLHPNEGAEGSHTVFERDANGRVTRYQTWEEEPRSPIGYNKGARFRGTGGPHSGIEPPLYYPTGGGLGVPAVGENLPLGY